MISTPATVFIMCHAVCVRCR